MTACHLVCPSDELGENSRRLFKLGSSEILVGRKSGKLFAFNNSCPHRGASLALGEIDGNRITCYMHGYEFDIFSGNLLKIKSWKKEDTWVEQSPAWRASGNLLLHTIFEQEGNIYVKL